MKTKDLSVWIQMFRSWFNLSVRQFNHLVKRLFFDQHSL
jgi:hypothetical protein